MSGKSKGSITANLHVDIKPAENMMEAFINKYNGRVITLKANIVGLNAKSIVKDLKTIKKVSKPAPLSNDIAKVAIDNNKKATEANRKFNEKSVKSAIYYEKKKNNVLASIQRKQNTVAKNRGKLEKFLNSDFANSLDSKTIKDTENAIKRLNEIELKLIDAKSKVNLPERITKSNKKSVDAMFENVALAESEAKAAIANSEKIIGINKDVTKSYNDVNASIKQTNYSKIYHDKMGDRLAEFYAKHGDQLKKNHELYDKFQNLMKLSNEGGFSSKTNADLYWADFRTQAREAGIGVETFGDKLKRTFGARVRSALAGNGVFLISGALRAIATNALEVDSALTELKKVTTATDAEYAKFMDGASSRAQRFGATLRDTVSATADFARLGYDIPEATKLADSAIVYQNVGDGIASMDDATSVMISTMQGFGIAAEDSMTIVDKFNEV